VAAQEQFAKTLEFEGEVILISASGGLSSGPLFSVNIIYGSKQEITGGIKIAFGHTMVEFPLVITLALGLITFSHVFLNNENLKIISIIRSSAIIVFATTIRSKVTLNRILEITNNSVKIEVNDEGTITGRYTGTQLATIDNTTNQDGTSSWSGKFMQMTNKGEMILSTGSGTMEPANSKGIVKIRGEGEMWTQSPRLGWLTSMVQSGRAKERAISEREVR